MTTISCKNINKVLSCKKDTVHFRDYYHNNEAFRKRQIAISNEYLKNKLATDPEYRRKQKEAKEKYYNKYMELMKTNEDFRKQEQAKNKIKSEKAKQRKLAKKQEAE